MNFRPSIHSRIFHFSIALSAIQDSSFSMSFNAHNSLKILVASCKLINTTFEILTYLAIRV